MSCLAQLPENQYCEAVFDGFGASTNFDLQTATAMMWMSQLSYETDPGKIDRILSTWDLERRLILKGPASRFLPLPCNRGLIASGHGATVVAFVGTDPLSFSHWITNFDFGLSNHDAHSGFEQAVDTTWDDLRAILEDSAATGRSVFMTGHSMGGAIAILAAHRARRELGQTVAGIYTFGGLRAGGQTFAAAYQLGDLTCRFGYGHDIFTKWPPRWLGYRHVGIPLSCPRGQTFKSRQSADTQIAAKMPVRNDLVGRLFRFLPGGLRDHIPDSYLRALG